jgi:hypothetical protein
MSNDVYANMMEVSCKAGMGKAVCAFPDVCFTPPQTPATPPGVPIPYPNTGMDSDTTDGSKSVKISNQEVMLKQKSYFKKSMGDEAGCAPKKGVITSKNMGKVYFNAWSMDVKVEGENVVRHLDLTTHNHASFPGDTPTWPFLAKQTVTKEVGPCKEEIKNEKAACGDCEPHTPGGKDPCSKPKCQEARKCMLAPYKAPKTGYANVHRCCDGLTGHHIVPVQDFSKTGKPRGRALNNSVKNYSENMAPCICAEGEDHKEYENFPPYQLKEHGLLGNANITQRQNLGLANGDKACYQDISAAGAQSVNDVFPQCSAECIQAQLDNYHVKECGIPPDKKVCRVSQQSEYDELDPSTM